MIQAIPDKPRYQVFMDHALPGNFEFMACFAHAVEAKQHAEHLHTGYRYGDVVVLDAMTGTLLLVLPGERTISGEIV